jgi:ubiquinone/menaquinone biosynthesis C-methylase UbiE
VVSQESLFEDIYRISLSPVLRGIERRVCGCDYGATSWTTRKQADHIGALLGLRPGARLLDVGAGAGWPGVYLAKVSGCDLTMTDLTPTALALGILRAARDGLTGAAAAADGARLPFADSIFDATSHSDALCCLPLKRETLNECRRVLRPDGRMVFTVIYIPTGLSTEAHASAAASGPTYIESDADYSTLLAETGWRPIAREDISTQYGQTCREMLAEFESNAEELARLMGKTDYEEKRAKLAAARVAIERGWQKRDLFVALPA